MGSAEVISRKVVNEDEEFVFYVLILKKERTFEANTICPQLLSKSKEDSEQWSEHI